MDVPTLLTAMAEYIRTIPGVASAHYPAPNALQAAECPAVVMFWGGVDETTVDHSNATSGTLWLPRVMARVYIPREGDSPQEFAKLDAMVTPLVDAFAVPVNSIPTLAGKVHRCRITRIRPMLQTEYAGHQYVVAEFYFDIKFHRRG